MSLNVFKVVAVDADAYIAIEDGNGPFIVDGMRCRISNAMPKNPGPYWRRDFLEGNISYVRWDVSTYQKGDKREVWDSSGGKDSRAIKYLGAEVIS